MPSWLYHYKISVTSLWTFYLGLLLSCGSALLCMVRDLVRDTFLNFNSQKYSQPLSSDSWKVNSVLVKNHCSGSHREGMSQLQLIHCLNSIPIEDGCVSENGRISPDRTLAGTPKKAFSRDFPAQLRSKQFETQLYGLIVPRKSGQTYQHSSEMGHKSNTMEDTAQAPTDHLVPHNSNVQLNESLLPSVLSITQSLMCFLHSSVSLAKDSSSSPA